ncbi:MAG: hypothetical protein IPN94_06990 [Sphingobacteriales bacterium]|nr:hypothetical protein [Sphingobacteriales bacterium]
MKNNLLICLVILLLSYSCNDSVEDNFPGAYPCCLQAELNNLLSKSPTIPRAKLEKYYYKGQYTYSLYPHDPDYFYYIWDEKCEIICIFGGIAGEKCDGWEDAEFIEVVWEDTR